MRIILALDPAATGRVGVAVLVDGVPVVVDHVQALPHNTLVQRVKELAGLTPDVVVVEIPRKYPSRRATWADVDRVLEVAKMLLAAFPKARKLTPSPSGWKRSRPKRLQGRRNNYEAPSHDASDALGLALYAHSLKDYLLP